LSIIDIERNKYSELWNDVPDYRIYSPGMENVPRFMHIIKPSKGSSLLDIGCGTGDSGLEFERLGLNVRWLDITDAGLNPIIPPARFTQKSLWSDWNRDWKYGYDYGFCCDVMEHIPIEFTMLVADRIISACRTSWFQIALVPDSFGSVIGQTLHLTVKPFAWWLEHFQGMGDVIEARDLCTQALFVVKR
jgi:hypothetical protein